MLFSEWHTHARMKKNSDSDRFFNESSSEWNGLPFARNITLSQQKNSQLRERHTVFFAVFFR